MASAPEPQVVQGPDLLSTGLLLDNGAGIGGDILAKYEGVDGDLMTPPTTAGSTS